MIISTYLFYISLVQYIMSNDLLSQLISYTSVITGISFYVYEEGLPLSGSIYIIIYLSSLTILFSIALFSTSPTYKLDLLGSLIITPYTSLYYLIFFTISPFIFNTYLNSIYTYTINEWNYSITSFFSYIWEIEPNLLKVLFSQIIGVFSKIINLFQDTI